jgi:hypothetical protein
LATFILVALDDLFSLDFLAGAGVLGPKTDAICRLRMIRLVIAWCRRMDLLRVSRATSRWGITPKTGAETLSNALVACRAYIAMQRVNELCPELGPVPRLAGSD